MLRTPTLEKLHTLHLTGMCKALEEQLQMPERETLSFEERLGLLVDRELTDRENRRLSTRLRKAKLHASQVFPTPVGPVSRTLAWSATHWQEARAVMSPLSSPRGWR